MRIDHAYTLRIAAVVLILILGVGYIASRPNGPVLGEAAVSSAEITPNADGLNDATRIAYRIRRDASLSIYFENEAGERFYFRQDEPRIRGEYEVLFSGVVDPYDREGETINGTVIQRLMPDGEYKWVIEAVDDATGRTDQATGTLSVADGDPVLPDLWEFSVSPEVFTPNQDGITDRVTINVYLAKESDLKVALIDEEGNRIYIPEFQQRVQPGEGGRHTFDYDGGIDNGSDPPPDGTYTVLVEAADVEGQRVEARTELTIQNGGKPFAEILAQPIGDTVRFSSETVLIGDVLMFEVTVENYGDSPIRTTGPDPGYIYNQSELFSSTGFYLESGAWRLGIGCDTCLTDYPWRWALGAKEDLTPIEVDGVTHYYLMPGQQTVITGGIRIDNAVPSRNPQYFWAGLIHEDVEIALINSHVDPHFIEIVDPTLQGD